MTKFFRKIRYNLMDKNPSSAKASAGMKTGKYLKYAIGEIVLVVIGILIALQINNWNEHRKKEKLKDSYKISLINDLSKDTLMLGKLISQNYRALNALRMQQKRFLGPETPIDTLIKIAKDEFDPELNTRFKYNRNTFKTLIASGFISLTDIKGFAHYSFINEIENVKRQTITFLNQLDSLNY